MAQPTFSLSPLSGASLSFILTVDRAQSVEILWGELRRLIRFGFATVTRERPMLQENEGTISTQDQPTGCDIFVSVEMKELEDARLRSGISHVIVGGAE